MAEKKHLEKLDHEKIDIISFSSFFVALEAALLAYITSSFLKQYISVSVVGYIFLASNLCSVFVILGLPRLVSRFGRFQTFIWFFWIQLLSLLGLAFFHQALLVIIFFFIYSFSLFAIYIGLDVFIEIFSEDCKTGEIRGRLLTIKNMAWVMAPIISGYLLAAYGFFVIFIVAALSMLIAIHLFTSIKGNYQHLVFPKFKLLKTLQKIKAHVNLFKIIIVAWFLEVFFAVMIIYLPLYLLDLGLLWSQIGIIFTIMLLPFVLFQYPAGWLADHKYGEKEILLFGFLIIGITTCLIFFLTIPNMYFWSILLFMNRIGASLAQIMIESYFGKQIDCQDIDLMNFFRLTKPMGVIIVTLVVSLLLLFYSLVYIFLVLGIFMLGGLLVVRRLEDTR